MSAQPVARYGVGVGSGVLEGLLELCGRFERPLLGVHGLKARDIAFCSLHDALEPTQKDLGALLEPFFKNESEHEAVTCAALLPHGFEWLFCDALLPVPERFAPDPSA